MGRLTVLHDEDERWFCPYYVDAAKSGARKLILCEGGTQIGFEDFHRFDAYADRYCRCGDYRECTVARSREQYWEEVLNHG